MNRRMVKIWIIIIFVGLAIPVLAIDKEEEAAIQAIKAGDIELLKSYLEKHPDLNCEFSNGKTGLYYAIANDQFEISLFLLMRGADPDFIVNDQSTLKWAIKSERERIARLLIEYGADVNKQDDKLNTPLIYAAELNNLEMCKILIDRGADPLHTNLKGKSASDFAIFYEGSIAYRYLLLMEKQRAGQDSIPSMQDGPYIYRETDDRIVMNYYERIQEKNLTRLIERTIETGKADTIVEGIAWDKNSYHIQHEYTPKFDDVETAGNIFVVGDIHGKYRALVNLLSNNKIIGPDLKWVFGSGQLVLLGDVFDRGGFVTETLWFLYELEIQARNSGGDVHLLLGNHEIMALTGDHRYVHYKYDYFTRYTRTYYFQLFEKNTVLGQWLRSQNAIARINDYLFMHAGISPEFAAFDYSYADINSRIRNYLNSGLKEEDGSPEDIILGPAGPLWYRGYVIGNTNGNDDDNYSKDGNDTMQVSQDFVDHYLTSKGLKRMILGHNEQLTINTSFEGKIISADVALDEDGKSAQGLLISGDELFRCYSDGRKEPIE